MANNHSLFHNTFCRYEQQHLQRYNEEQDRLNVLRDNHSQELQQKRESEIAQLQTLRETFENQMDVARKEMESKKASLDVELLATKTKINECAVESSRQEILHQDNLNIQKANYEADLFAIREQHDSALSRKGNTIYICDAITF